MGIGRGVAAIYLSCLAEAEQLYDTEDHPPDTVSVGIFVLDKDTVAKQCSYFLFDAMVICGQIESCIWVGSHFLFHQFNELADGRVDYGCLIIGASDMYANGVFVELTGNEFYLLSNLWYGHEQIFHVILLTHWITSDKDESLLSDLISEGEDIIAFPVKAVIEKYLPAKMKVCRLQQIIFSAVDTVKPFFIFVYFYVRNLKRLEKFREVGF